MTSILEDIIELNESRRNVRHAVSRRSLEAKNSDKEKFKFRDGETYDMYRKRANRLHQRSAYDHASRLATKSSVSTNRRMLRDHKDNLKRGSEMRKIDTDGSVISFDRGAAQAFEDRAIRDKAERRMKINGESAMMDIEFK